MKYLLNSALKTGISFGLTSGTITTIGLMVGLNAATGSKPAIIGGIITIAVADAFSDSLGIHVSEESKKVGTKKVWESTASTFFTKLVYALTFTIPFFFLPLTMAIITAIVWGILVICSLSYAIAVADKEKPVHVIIEHLSIMILVVIITNFVGEMVSRWFI